MSENRSGPARSPSSGVRSQEAERENRESTRAAAVSRTALSGEEEEQKRLPERTGLRAGDTRAQTTRKESRETPPPPLGPEPREQRAPPPPQKETTGYTAVRGEK